MTGHSPSGSSDSLPVDAERVTIRGTVRWAFTDRGRIIVQFADEQDLIMALRLLEEGPALARRADETTLEFQLPEVRDGATW